MLSIGKMVARSEDYYLRTVAAGREEYYTGAGRVPGHLGRGGSTAPRARAARWRQPTCGRPRRRLARWRDPDRRRRGRRQAGGGLRPHLLGPEVGLPPLRALRAATSRPPCAPPTPTRSPTPSATSSATRSASAAEPAASGDRRRRSRRRPPSCTGRRGPATPSSTPTCWWPTSRWATTAPGRPPTPACSTSTPAPPASSTRPRCAPGWARPSGSASGRSPAAWPSSRGCPRRVLRAFSTRRREIEHLLDATGSHSARAAEAAALVTRLGQGPRSGVGRRRAAGALARPGRRARPGPPSRVRTSSTTCSVPSPGRPPRTPRSTRLLARLVGPDGLTAVELDLRAP